MRPKIKMLEIYSVLENVVLFLKFISVIILVAEKDL